MSMRVTMNEKQVAPFATEQHARTIIEQLQAKGWQGIAYGEKQDAWHFDTVNQYNRFIIDLENTIDEITEVCSISFSWDCQCKSELSPWDCQCGAGGQS